MILISVIIPLYNKEKTIVDTIFTVLEQTYKNLELIIVDDGSTDRSYDKIKNIKDKRIKYYKKKNGGVSSARNYGIEQSNGDYIFFLDADDIIYKNCLEELINTFYRYPLAQIICGNYYSIYCGKKTVVSTIKEGYIENSIKEFYNEKLSPRTGVLLIKRSILLHNNFNTNISVHEDTELWIKLMKQYKWAYTPTIIHEYHKEFSELSVNTISLKKEFSYYIKLNTCQSKYEKRVLANNIVCSIINRIQKKEFLDAASLLSKNIIYIPYFFFIYIKRKIK